MNNNSQDPQNEFLDLEDLDLAEFSEQPRPVSKLEFNREETKLRTPSQPSLENKPSQEQNNE